jgi:hypothetical protein
MIPRLIQTISDSRARCKRDRPPVRIGVIDAVGEVFTEIVDFQKTMYLLQVFVR